MVLVWRISNDSTVHQTFPLPNIVAIRYYFLFSYGFYTTSQDKLALLSVFVLLHVKDQISDYTSSTEHF